MNKLTMNNMKKILILMCLLLSTASFAQTNSSEQTAPAGDSQKYVYCQLLGYQHLFGKKVKITVDFGQESKLISFTNKNKVMVDENNKPIVFNSMIDGLNYMGQDGWNFVQAYAITMGSTNVYHYLLRKDISTFSEEEQKNIFDSIKLKQ